MRERLEALKIRLDRGLGRRDQLTEDCELFEKKIEEQRAQLEVTVMAQEIVNGTTEVRRAELRDRVESLVTQGLQAVFRRTDYEFFFETKFMRGSFGATPKLRSLYGDDVFETGIIEGHGGGIADVVSFLMRTVVLSLSRPKLAPVLFLDESFRHVSPEFLPGVAVLLRELNQSAGMQFFLVTHKPELLDAADVIYQTRLRRGKTEFVLEHDYNDEAYHARPKRGQKARDTTTVFDGEDLNRGMNKAEPVYSRDPDLKAKRQRKRVKDAMRETYRPFKLSDPEVRKEIKRRFANGESKRSLAAEYGVHRRSIKLIVEGKRYKEDEE